MSATAKTAGPLAAACCVSGCAERGQAGSPSRTRTWDEEAFSREIVEAIGRVGRGNLPVGRMRMGNMPLTFPESVVALTRYGSRAEGVLRKHIGSPEVALALGTVGTDACIDDLIAALGTCDSDHPRAFYTRLCLVWALRNLTGCAVADSPRRWGEWAFQEDLGKRWEEWRRKGGKALPRRKRAQRRLPSTIILLNDPWTSVFGEEPGPNVPVKCSVVEVDDAAGLVRLSAGNDQGVKPGYRFIIYRGDEYIGKVEVVEVTAESCYARILRDRLRQGESIKVGDNASTRAY